MKLRQDVILVRKKFTSYVMLKLNQQHEDAHWRNVWSTLHTSVRSHCTLWLTWRILLIAAVKLCSCRILWNGTCMLSSHSVVVGRYGNGVTSVRCMRTAICRWTGIPWSHSRTGTWTMCISCTTYKVTVTVEPTPGRYASASAAQHTRLPPTRQIPGPCKSCNAPDLTEPQKWSDYKPSWCRSPLKEGKEGKRMVIIYLTVCVSAEANSTLTFQCTRH